MASYKLEYFDVRGRGEVTRMLLALAGKKFEDVRISLEQYTDEYKKKLPCGQLPVFDVDGKQLVDSAAINSYLAREFGYYGSSSWEAALIDQVVGVVSDIWTPLIETVFMPDEAAQIAKQKELFDGKVQGFMKFLEDALCKNGEGDGFFVGDKISLADLNFHTAMESLENLKYTDKNLDKYPKLAALRTRISADKGLSEYLAARPTRPI
ncbi:S-crystallin SL11-like [Asterias rubens]|uniref:S-crystallin SL11-like n=1 Tax=Asterias rubens TaxID=7604 RepID=UPI0014551E0C|nr:S-crystallin SL11-like [Asterias rubens]